MYAYSLRPCEPADEPALLDLFALVFGQVRPSAEWRWKFVSSQALTDGLATSDSLVALDQHGAIVAYAGALRLPGWFRGNAIPVIQICDVMVHPEHRGGLGQNNLFTLMLRDLLERLATRYPTAFRYGFPGERPYILGERSGVYERMEIAVEIDPRSRRRVFSPWRVNPLAWDDPRLDRLWRRLRGQYELSLIRDGAYLRWRYADNPSHDYHLTGLSLLGRLMGWVVSRREGERRLLVDVLVPRPAVRPALQAVAGSDPLAVTRVWLPESWRGAVEGPRRETPVVAANMCWHGVIETEAARRSLYYTMGDVDIF